MAAHEHETGQAGGSDLAALAMDSPIRLEQGSDTEQLEVRLRLLRGFELTASGRPVDLSLGSQRLLGLLAIHDQPVKRNFVAFTLWIDKSEERASANLRAALWRLRRLGYGLTESTSSHLSLGRDIVVDYREHIQQAQAVLTGAVDISHGAVDSLLVDGDLLPDWYEDWTAGPRERLRQLRLHALEVVCGQFVGSGRIPEAIDVGLAAVSAEPLRESAHRALIEAHLAEGNHAEALRQYEAYRYRVHTEIGILPSDQMEDLVAPIRDIGLRGSGAAS